jgi:hypothetical protein
MHFDLRGFQCVVLLDWRELRPSAEYPWDWLCDTLRGAGVANLDQELTHLRLRPLYDALRQAICSDRIQVLATIACEREPSCPATSPSTAEASTALSTLDSRLQPLVEKSQAFYDKLLEVLPADSRVPMGQPTASASPEPSSGSTPAPSIRKTPTYADSVRAAAATATLIPSLAQSFTTDWAAEARRLLPGRKPGTPADHAWAPLLAWIVLRSLPFPGDRVALFDRLELRWALAEIFSSMGMEGEAKWRAAAQVRMLLAEPAAKPVSPRSQAFWSDPDVRWLAGVNTASGVTYFNREQFEELLAWLQLPALIEIAQQPSAQPRAIAELESAFAAACEAAHDAGYRLDLYIATAKPQPAKPPVPKPAETIG